MSLENSPKSYIQFHSFLSNKKNLKLLKSIFFLVPFNSTPSKENNHTTRIDFPDKSYYEGEINKSNNLPNGKGYLFYSNGETFFGNFKNGIKEGEGEYYYNDGTIYIGSWKNDKKNGKGIYICEENNWIFNGIFIEGIPGIGNFQKISEIYENKNNNNINEKKFVNNNENKFIIDKNTKIIIENEVEKNSFQIDYCPIIKNLNFNI